MGRRKWSGASTLTQRLGRKVLGELFSPKVSTPGWRNWAWSSAAKEGPPAIRKAEPPPIHIPQPQGMMVLREQHRCRLHKPVLKLAVTLML